MIKKRIICDCGKEHDIEFDNDEIRQFIDNYQNIMIDYRKRMIMIEGMMGHVGVSEAAKMMDVHHTTIRRWMRSGVLDEVLKTQEKQVSCESIIRSLKL
jgi:DUF438 domain-containing protein